MSLHKSFERSFRTNSTPIEDIVRQLRVENGLTQTDLGQMVNVSRQTIYAVESGRFDPSIWLAFDIAQLFDMKIEDVFDFTDRIRK